MSEEATKDLQELTKERMPPPGESKKHLGIEKVIIKLTTYEVATRRPWPVTVDSRYHTTFESPDTKGNNAWQETSVFNISINPRTLEIIDIDWISEEK